MKNLTVKQLMNAAEKNPYMLCRTFNNYLIGINSKVAKIAEKRGQCENLNAETEFIGFIGCSFMEYLNYKVKFA